MSSLLVLSRVYGLEIQSVMLVQYTVNLLQTLSCFSYLSENCITKDVKARCQDRTFFLLTTELDTFFYISLPPCRKNLPVPGVRPFTVHHAGKVFRSEE
jgi:hypothetical protein